MVFMVPLSALCAERTILVLGDSLSAAYGIRAEQGWVALLKQRLEREGYGYAIVNASVSGETSGGGVQRLPRALELHHPEIVILELGANDGLRGLPVRETRASLTRLVKLCRDAGARVLILGIRLPPNYGPKYAEEFARMYPDLAAEFDLPIVPFLLQDVALKPALMQDDGLHPNAAGEPTVLETVWKSLEPMLKKSHH
jgi:acyl-CoA thioesterase-1